MLAVAPAKTSFVQSCKGMWASRFPHSSGKRLLDKYFSVVAPSDGLKQDKNTKIGTNKTRGVSSECVASCLSLLKRAIWTWKKPCTSTPVVLQKHNACTARPTRTRFLPKVCNTYLYSRRIQTLALTAAPSQGLHLKRPCPGLPVHLNERTCHC